MASRAAVVAFACLWLAFGCKSAANTDGEPDAGQAADVFEGSSCAACLTTACASELKACSADSDCATYWNCLDGCPLADSGAAEPTCAGACAGSEAAGDARTALVACIQGGAGQACAACGGMPSGSTAPSASILNQSCPSSTETDACFKCEDERCCTTEAACVGDPECEAFTTCMKTCSDSYSPCVDQCTSAHPAGVAAFAARLACVEFYCADDDACGNQPLDPCLQCTNSGCPDETVNCDADETCFELSNCVGECGTNSSCVDACRATYPTATGAFDAFTDCAMGRCAPQCG